MGAALELAPPPEDATELTADELAPPEAAADAAAELDDVAAAVVLDEDAVAVDVPVQLDSSGTAAALATPAPSTRNIVRRFIPVLRRSASKSEPVTV